MTRIRFVPALLGVALIAACSKDGVQGLLTGPTAGAYIKFFNFGVNAPSVNFYANDTKVTAISSTSCSPPPTTPNPACTTTGAEVTTGTAYGSAGNGGLYSTLAPGQYAFNGRISAAADNGVQVAKLSSSLSDGKFYSLYTSGFYDANTKTMESFIIEDPIPAQIDFTVSTARFVNGISNSSPMTLYAKNTVTGDSVVVGSSIAYKAAGAFVTLPPAIYDLTVRAPGSSTALFVRTGVSLSAGRTYSISARGDMTVVSTTATSRPFLDVTANR